MKFSDEEIGTVRARTRIEDVIGSYTQLVPYGELLAGICPLHGSPPSRIYVNPAVGLWSCYSCHDGGDVISFIETIERASFNEAVELLAARVGIPNRQPLGHFNANTQDHLPGAEL